MFFLKFNKVVLFSKTLSFRTPFEIVEIETAFQLCCQIAPLPFDKTPGQLKFPGLILIKNLDL